jgi:cell division septum initiation protein DivIVA
VNSNARLGDVAWSRHSLEADLKDLAAAARDRLRDEAEARRALVEQLGSREVQAAASQDDPVMAALQSALEGVAEDEAADERRLAVVEQAVAERADELPALDR